MRFFRSGKENDGDEIRLWLAKLNERFDGMERRLMELEVKLKVLSSSDSKPQNEVMLRQMIDDFSTRWTNLIHAFRRLSHKVNNMELATVKLHNNEKQSIESSEVSEKISEPVLAAVPSVPGVAELIQKLSNLDVVDAEKLNKLAAVNNMGEFVERMIADCLLHWQLLSSYQAVDVVIRQASNASLSLIMPKEGQRVNGSEHTVIKQQTVDKGALNVVYALVLPGLWCDGVVRRKALIIETI